MWEQGIDGDVGFLIVFSFWFFSPCLYFGQLRFRPHSAMTIGFPLLDESLAMDSW